MLDIDGAARKRSTCDLIDELDAEVECSILAAIAVGFETKTTFIFAADVNRLTLLNALLPKHGLPLGIVGLRDGPEGVQFYYRPFREFAAATWVPRHLAALEEVLLAIYRGDLHPALLCPRNN